MAASWTPEDDETLRTLHAAGRTLGDVATTMGRSKATISRHAQLLGLGWDRTQVARATKARAADNRARRAELEAGLLADAARLRAQLFAPTVAFNFGGKDNTYEEHDLEEPTFADKLKILQGIGVAVDRALRIAQHDSGVGTDDAKSLLGDLGRALGVNDAR